MKRLLFLLLVLSGLFFISCSNQLTVYGDTGNSGDTGDTGDSVDTANSGNSADSGDTANSGDTVDSGNTANSGDTADSVDTANSGNTANSGDTANTGALCHKNDECGSRDFFCKKAAGQCDSEGICTAVPSCDEGTSGNETSQVCGCDGITYDSECLAHRNGTNVAHEGICGQLKPTFIHYDYDINRGDGSIVAEAQIAVGSRVIHFSQAEPPQRIPNADSSVEVQTQFHSDDDTLVLNINLHIQGLANKPPLWIGTLGQDGNSAEWGETNSPPQGELVGQLIIDDYYRDRSGRMLKLLFHADDLTAEELDY